MQNERAAAWQKKVGFPVNRYFYLYRKYTSSREMETERPLLSAAAGWLISLFERPVFITWDRSRY